MHNAVIDTNVLVSGLLSANGTPARIIDAFKERQFYLYYSKEILTEYQDVLCREKLGLSTKDVEVFLYKVCRVGISVMSVLSNIPLIDEDDRVFYDTARTSGAVLVTGNIRHYPAEPFIMTPADFLKALNLRS